MEEKGLTKSLKYFESVGKICVPKPNLTKIQRLDKIAKDKDLTLLSSYDDYKNLDTELKWLCNVCGCEFDGSSDKVKTARTPCRNCRSFISKRHY